MFPLRISHTADATKTENKQIEKNRIMHEMEDELP